MHDTTKPPIYPCLLDFCRIHRCFYPHAQQCPQCTHVPEQLTPVGILLVWLCLGGSIVYVVLQSFLGPGHGPFGWW